MDLIDDQYYQVINYVFNLLYTDIAHYYSNINYILDAIDQ